MKTDEMDKLIKKIIEEDSNLYKDVEDSTPMESILNIFKGKMKWIYRISMVIMIVLFGFSIFCVFKFFEVESTKELIAYATGFGISMMMVGYLKLGQLQQIDRNLLLREFKKHELRIISGK